MEQLHMFWKNDGTPVPAYTLPEGYTVKAGEQVDMDAIRGEA